jgi:hypothetical protein
LISVKAAQAPFGFAARNVETSEAAMLTWEDCVALCDLTEDEIRAIAQHEHIPLMAAVELGTYLVHTPHGAPRLSRMIVDDIKAAEARGDRAEALKLMAILSHFVERHRPAPMPTARCC